ncbi:hypothetical protein OY671_012410, partial [Metschnikowia pulcherrima]
TTAFAKARRRIAYERSLLDSIEGQQTLFVRRDEVEAQWRWVDGIRKVWAAESMEVRWAEPGDAAAVADRIAAESAKPGPKRIAVPGGSTPVKVFASSADRALDWSGVTLCLTDDRQV